MRLFFSESLPLLCPLSPSTHKHARGWGHIRVFLSVSIAMSVFFYDHVATNSQRRQLRGRRNRFTR